MYKYVTLISIHTYIHTYIHLHTYIHIYIYTYTYIHIYTYIYIYIYIYILLYTCTKLRQLHCIQTRVILPTMNRSGFVSDMRQSAAARHGHDLVGAKDPDVIDESSCRRGDAEDDRPCVLLTNDDGIGAPGLRAMAIALLHTNSCHVLVCAPNG